MEKEIINKRVLPYVKKNKVIVNGKEVTKMEELSTKEVRNMSCESMLLEFDINSNTYHLVDTPLTAVGRETGIRMFLCYDFDKLTIEEQEKYFDRSIVIPVVNYEKEKEVLREDIVQRKPVTRLFSRKRTRG